MSTSVENLLRQAVPILYNDPTDLNVLKLYILKDREVVYMDEAVAVTQDITDKESAGHLVTAASAETPGTRFDIA